MKTLKNIALVITGLVAWMTIGVSGAMTELRSPLTWDDFVYAIVLVLSVIYFHWALRTFLVPIKKLPPTQAEELRDAAYTKYAKGFFAGTIGIGYVLLVFHIVAVLDRTVSHKPSSFLSLALFFIALGIFAQTRAIIDQLCKALMKHEGK